MRVGIGLAVGFVVGLSAWGWGHDAPVQLPPPQSEPEAWNVIEQSSSNVDQLIDANLLHDVGGQLANISVALRYLNGAAGEGTRRELSSSLLGGEAELLQDSRDTQQAGAKIRPVWGGWRKHLAELESRYSPDTVHAEVYICPMHPLDRHLKPDERCSICGMALVRRHLPASGVYQRPGEPTLKLTASCETLTVGKPASVTIHLAHADGSPVLLSELIETHTKKIHLLINDASLSDYHHEHPVATQTPGDYQFSFTPMRPGPYRVWADVVPAVSGVQEYDICDLPGSGTGGAISDRQARMTNVADGRRYELAIDSGSGPIRAGQTYVGTIAVTSADGTPFTQLEPVMGAFAHLVGFSEDGKSVLHIHPSGKEPKSDGDRAGPVFAFKFYAPSAGFLRLYCQVRIGGADVFVPFNLTVTE